MSQNPAIVDAEDLKRISGKRSRRGIAQWASKRGIRLSDGAAGPWTTVDALNAGLGLPSANQETYRPDEIL